MAWQMAADHGIGLRHVVRGQVTSPQDKLIEHTKFYAYVLSDARGRSDGWTPASDAAL